AVAGASETPYVTAFSGIRALNGGSQNDTLFGSDSTNNWTVTAQNSGTLGTVSFSGMENLVGGIGVDNFVFTQRTSNVTGVIDAGTDPDPRLTINDTLDLTVFSNDGVNVRIGTDLDENAINIINIESVQASVIVQPIP